MFNFSSTDLGPSLLRIAIALAVMAVAVGLVVVLRRRRGSRTIALDAALTISGWWVMLSTIGMAVCVVKAFTSSWAELDGFTNVWVSWPSDLPCSEFGDGEGAMLACAGQSLSDFSVSNASLGLRLLAATAQIAALALATMPALMLAMICFQTLRGRTFSRTITRTLTIGAVSVLVLGISSDLLGGIAATAGLREVFSPGSQWYPESFQLTVTPMPFVGALALVALAAVFREGSRLQLERERLQREKAALEKETEGLV